jgi:hypothetical protein
MTKLRTALPLVLILALAVLLEPAGPTSAGGQAASALDLATAAELAFYPNATVLSPTDACDAAHDPLGSACIVPLSDEGTAEAGLAMFGVAYPDMDQVREVMGRMMDGSWQPWFRAQNVIYQLMGLPGAMTVCSEGTLVDLRSSPSASGTTLQVLTDRAPLMADGFVLAQAGSFSETAPPAADIGWYHLTAPKAGWIASRDASDAALGTCSWHDALKSLN